MALFKPQGCWEHGTVGLAGSHPRPAHHVLTHVYEWEPRLVAVRGPGIQASRGMGACWPCPRVRAGQLVLVDVVCKL